MKKITVIGSINLTDDQKARLAACGTVTYTESPESSKEWLAAVEGADIICSDGSNLYENLSSLKNVFATYPFIELGTFDAEELKKKGVYVANTQGSNRDSLVEWTMYMLLALFRELPGLTRITESQEFRRTRSLFGKKVLIVGKGNIGSQVGVLCEAFGMKVDYFTRGGDLSAQSKDADVVVNCLNCNSSSKNLLDAAFFAGMKQGSFYATFSRPYTYDIDGLIEAIDDGIVAGAGIDCDPEPAYDTTNAFYQKCLANPKILVTPHCAALTDQAGLNAPEILVQNVEAFASGKPQNVITKR